jgi:nicotinamidase-related amidase
VKKGIFTHQDSYSAFFYDGIETFLRKKIQELDIK